MGWEALCKLYLDSYQGTTRDTYGYGVKQYTEWCTTQNIKPLDATRSDIQSYLNYLIEKQYAQATVGSRFGVVCGLYKVAIDEDLLIKNPTTKIRTLRIDRESQRRTVMTPLEFAAFLRTAEAMGIDEYVIAVLGGMLGLRAAEMLQLQASNLGNKNGYVTLSFVGKGARSAVLPLPVPVIRPVQIIAEQRPNGRLLRTKTGREMDRRDLNRYVKRIAERAGVLHPITTHGLRRTYATSGFMKGVSLRDMQIAMRHTRSETTLLYDLDRGSLDRHASHEIAAFLSGFAS